MRRSLLAGTSTAIMLTLSACGSSIGWQGVGTPPADTPAASTSQDDPIEDVYGPPPETREANPAEDDEEKGESESVESDAALEEQIETVYGPPPTDK